MPVIKIHSAVLYTELGLMCLDGKLCKIPKQVFKMTLNGISILEHELKLYIHNDFVRLMCNSSNQFMFCFPLSTCLPMMQYIRRLQRHWRDLLWSRRAVMREAVAMALHPRLGSTSGLSQLCEDLIGLILKK